MRFLKLNFIRKFVILPANEFPKARKVNPRKVGLSVVKSPISYKKSMRTFETK